MPAAPLNPVGVEGHALANRTYACDVTVRHTWEKTTRWLTVPRRGRTVLFAPVGGLVHEEQTEPQAACGLLASRFAVPLSGFFVACMAEHYVQIKALGKGSYGQVVLGWNGQLRAGDWRHGVRVGRTATGRLLAAWC